MDPPNKGISLSFKSIHMNFPVNYSIRAKSSQARLKFQKIEPLDELSKVTSQILHIRYVQKKEGRKFSAEMKSIQATGPKNEC